MNLISMIAKKEDRLGPIILQIVILISGTVVISFFPLNYRWIGLIFPVVIGWYFNQNEVHRIILIPIWIIIAWIIAASLS